MKKNHFLSYEWDAIAGILAAVVAIILHFLHVIDEQIILPVVLTLMALLFINFMRHTRNNENTADQVEHVQKIVSEIKSSLTAPDIVLIGPRQLREANGKFLRNMRGEVTLFNVCLSMYRTQSLFDSMLRPAIENPLVTRVQFVLDESQRGIWQTEVWPIISIHNVADKVKEPRWCTLDKNLSFILADTYPHGAPEALVSFWGEPFMSQSTAQNIPRYILHVQAHSELITQLVELDRNCHIHNFRD
ncbi:4-alpha-glucanotransferase [Novimethylophilus kurashikiensis]|uniref:4-alpha-glucanotransferase n=1 Tax=Novimethylophilus kurashikiensis TaxID=1825523 RepID=A0A2R5FCV1_9PROT|nr:hypothetical protein [Novimethylophilus kurashikiensis]GBG16037.1 4-alpha-glucanotransferase [Novimethylophilus kurashikiensis]